LGTEFVETPGISGARSIVHFVLLNGLIFEFVEEIKA
jgi:hypothetical protein